MSLFQKLVRLPAFLLGVFFMYWSLVFTCLAYRIKFLQFQGKRNDCHDWSTFITAVFRVKCLAAPGPKIYRGENIMYLSNHRGWADFFLDSYLSEGRAQLLSRLAVFFVFPAFVTSVYILKGVVIFVRGPIADKERFNAWIDKQVADSPMAGLLVFPEGHRSQKRNSLPLKRGMLHYAYSRKVPVQIIMTKNKERVLNEKSMRVSLGGRLIVGYSEVIGTAQFKTFDEFFTKLSEIWLEKWEEIFSMDPEGLPELKEQMEVPRFDYSFKTRVLLLLSVVSSMLYFVVTLLTSWRVMKWLLQSVGYFTKNALIVGLCWTLLSLSEAFIAGLQNAKSQGETKRPVVSVNHHQS